MAKHVLIVFIILAALTATFLHFRAADKEAAKAYDAACAGPPLRNLQERNQAMEDGYNINAHYGCIDKSSQAQMAAYRAAEAKLAARGNAAANAGKPSAKSGTATGSTQTLAEARRGVRTALTVPAGSAEPLPAPPPALFVRSDYKNGSGQVLAAFVSPDPRDGKKHPAIIWLTGGDSNSLNDFWTPGQASNDQSASALRNAGIVMMFPTLRGGNTNPGTKEILFGEVDDVLAAAKHLAKQPYIDPAQIYLGGHSTGGTLALLAAEMGGRFSAIFALGPVAEIESYGNLFDPVNLRFASPDELRLRSPIHWLHGIVAPTYAIEGTESPNLAPLNELCAKSTNPQLHCIRATGMTHFSVIHSVTKVIAARIVTRSMGLPFELRADEFERR